MMPIQPWDDGPEEVVADDRDEAEERWSQEENAYREEYRDHPFNPNLNPNLFPWDMEEIHQERAW